MSSKFDQSRESAPTNGWTQYQKLVLAELERHDETLNSLNREIVDLKLGQGKIGSDIVNFNREATKSLDALKELMEDSANELKESKKEFDAAKDAINEQKLNINKINFKVGAIISGVSMLVSALVSALFKFFFLH